MRVRRIGNIAEGTTMTDPPSGPKRTVAKSPTVLTEAEAARFIGMSSAWLKKSRTKRFRGVADAPSFIRAGAKRVLYRIEDLEAWQERHLEHVGPKRRDDENMTATIPKEREAIA